MTSAFPSWISLASAAVQISSYLIRKQPRRRYPESMKLHVLQRSGRSDPGCVCGSCFPNGLAGVPSPFISQGISCGCSWSLPHPDNKCQEWVSGRNTGSKLAGKAEGSITTASPITAAIGGRLLQCHGASLGLLACRKIILGGRQTLSQRSGLIYSVKNEVSPFELALWGWSFCECEAFILSSGVTVKIFNIY